MTKSRLTISGTLPLWPLGDGCFFSVIFKLKVKILDLIRINDGDILYFQKSIAKISELALDFGALCMQR
jgi:hypothetical protein